MTRFRFSLLAAAVVFAAALFFGSSAEAKKDSIAAADVEEKGLARATFAGGCFWCMEPPYDKTDGVKATVSGYIGGPELNPTYKEVAAGKTGHTEAVQVIYDPKVVTYEELLHIFWRNIDPTVKDRQFCDWGTQYRTGIFYHGEEQGKAAAASKQELLDSKRFAEVFTEVTEASTFYPAETYHQNFYKKNPAHYQRYRRGCGRDQRLHELWGDDK